MMRKLACLLFLFVCSLQVWSQTCDECEELYVTYRRLDEDYKAAKTTAKKKNYYERMKRVLSWAQEYNCPIPPQWTKDLNRRKAELSSGQNEYVFSSAEDQVVVGIKSGWRFVPSDLPSWLVYVLQEENGLIFNIQENESIYERSCVIEVEKDGKRQKCKIKQEGAPLVANITEYVGFDMDGGDCPIFVETNDKDWTIEGGEKWLEVDRKGPNLAVAHCKASTDKKKRSTEIKIKLDRGKTYRKVVVTQHASKPEITIPKKMLSFDNQGGIDSKVDVSCNYGNWTATSSASWVHVERKYGGISVVCDPNPVASKRTATVKIATGGDYPVEDSIIVVQEEAAPYLEALIPSYQGDGNEETINIAVKTNFTDWDVMCAESWLTVTKNANSSLTVHLTRNDWNAERTAVINLMGHGKIYVVRITQPDRGYMGRFNDYYDTHGVWRVTWVSVDFHGMTTVGNNLSVINARWKPVELSLVNFNFDYVMEGGFSASWEPIVRGYMPITRDGKWAGFAGLGAHVSMTGGYHHFLLELGAEWQWKDVFSSRIFFRYNGGFSLGMSFDFDKWYK